MTRSIIQVISHPLIGIPVLNKYILILSRDPVMRLLSDYHHEQRLPDVVHKQHATNVQDTVYHRRKEKDQSFEELVFTEDGRLSNYYSVKVIF